MKMKDNIKGAILKFEKERLKFDRSLEMHMAKAIKSIIDNRKKAYIEEIDQGFDFSIHGRSSNEKLTIDTYETMDDLLNAPTGNTVATYCSGHGFSVETYEDVLSYDYNCFLSKWIENNYPGIDSDDWLRDEFYDALLEINIDSYVWFESKKNTKIYDWYEKAFYKEILTENVNV